MGDGKCNPKVCIWSESDSFCKVLAKADVPLDKKWPFLILYLRGISDVPFLSEVQKNEMQELLVAALKNKNFTAREYKRIQETIHSIIKEPLETKLTEIAREAQDLTREVQAILGRRKQDVISVAEHVKTDIANGVEPSNILAGLRNALHDVVCMMETDTQALLNLSHHDCLTGLANRRSFESFLDEAIMEWVSYGTPVSLIMFDIDEFKKFNDTYGHLVGDQVLQTLAVQVKRIASELESAGGRVLVSRYGGEEFTVILRGRITTKAFQIAEAIRETVRGASLTVRDSKDNIVESGLRVTISLGVASMWKGWTGAFQTNLVDCADKALYHAKRSGRNCTVAYAPESANAYTMITPGAKLTGL